MGLTKSKGQILIGSKVTDNFFNKSFEMNLAPSILYSFYLRCYQLNDGANKVNFINCVDLVDKNNDSQICLGAKAL